MVPEQIRIDIADQIAIITLNRPEKLNAFTPQMGFELAEAIPQLDNNDDVRVIVVTGAGRAFCAGVDLSRQDPFGSAAQPSRNAVSVVDIEPWTFKKPIIAAINGVALGVGITMPLQWDIRVASESARIGFLFARRGVVPEGGCSWLLPRIVGLPRAQELLLTGRIIDAHEALEYGLVTHVWPDAELIPRALEIAKEIAVNTAPVSISATKRLIHASLCEPDIRKARITERLAFKWAASQPDASEAVSAYLEKRKPDWKLKSSQELPEFLAR